jgi:hypothetical protein
MKTLLFASALALAAPLATAAAQTPVCQQTPSTRVNAAGQLEERTVCPPREINQPTVSTNMPTVHCRDGSVVTTRRIRGACNGHGGPAPK